MNLYANKTKLLSVERYAETPNETYQVSYTQNAMLSSVPILNNWFWIK